jgi:hypothetical protein
MADNKSLLRAAESFKEEVVRFRLGESQRGVDHQERLLLLKKIAELHRQLLLQESYPFLTGQLSSALQEIIEGKFSCLTFKKFQATVNFDQTVESFLEQGGYQHSHVSRPFFTEELVNNFDRIFLLNQPPCRSLTGTWNIVYTLFGFRYCPIEPEIAKVFDDFRCRTVSAKELLVFGTLFPEEQKKYPIVQNMVFPPRDPSQQYKERGMLCLTAARGNRSERILRLNGDYRDIWKDHPETGCRFLAVSSLDKMA